MQVGTREILYHIRCCMIRDAQFNEQNYKLTKLWLSSDNKLLFHNMPRVTDPIHFGEGVALEPVIRGIYWFINKSGTRGALSPGQCFDLFMAMDILVNFYKANKQKQPSLKLGAYEVIATIARVCFDNGCCMIFDSSSPPQQPQQPRPIPPLNSNDEETKQKLKNLSNVVHGRLNVRQNRLY